MSRSGSPRRSVHFALLPFVVVACLFLVHANGAPVFDHLDPGARLFDEGFILSAVAKIMDGEVLYRDFWAFYAPGQYYTLAGLFTLFGASIAVERLWDFIARCLLLLGVYGVAARLTSPRAAFVPFVLIALWLASCEFYGYPAFPATALTLISMACLLAYWSSRRARWLTASGILVCAATLYRHDFGAYAFIAQLVALGAHTALDLREHGFEGADQIRRAGRAVVAYMAGVAMLALPVGYYFLANVPAEVLYYDLVFYPLRVFPGLSVLAYPELLPDMYALTSGCSSPRALASFVAYQWVPFYGPLIVYSIGLITSIKLSFSQRASIHGREHISGLMMLMSFGFLLFNQAINRNDMIHLLPTSVVAAILLSTLGHWLIAASRPRRRLAWLSPILLLIAIPYLVVPLAVTGIIVAIAVFPASTESLLARLGSGRSVEGQSAAIEYIRSHTSPDERIFVGTATHDVAWRNDAMFYFLSGRHNVTRHNDFIAAPINRATIQEEVVRDLQTTNTRYVVLSSALRGRPEPNLSAAPGGPTILDDYLREHYAPAAEFGNYVILRRRE